MKPVIRYPRAARSRSEHWAKTGLSMGLVALAFVRYCLARP